MTDVGFRTLILTAGITLILCSASLQAQNDTPASLMTSQPITEVTDFSIDLGGVVFDPLLLDDAAGPIFQAGWDQVRDDVPDMHLVQFTGPTQQAWLDELEARGIRAVQYVHPYAYVVWGMSESVRDVAGQGPRGERTKMQAVRWASGFAPACRVLSRWRNLPADAVDARMMLYREADTKNVIQQLIALGAVNTGVRVIDATFEIATFRMSGALFQAAAHVPGVYSIKTVPTDGGLRGEMTNMMNVTAANGLVPTGYASWLTTAGVNGNGVIIANVDGGVSENNPDLVGRFLPCVGSSCSSTSSTHGTHTAGIMAATGASGVTANGGFLRGQGVAPGANLVEQVYSPTFNLAGGMLLLMTHSTDNGASLSGNSWGPSGSPLGYDDDTRQCDVGVRDADPLEAGNQPLTFVLSFMNGNGGTSTQGTPDEGKNLFTIGSTKGQVSGTGAQITQINDLSSNTAHGPALDGRKIPHMVAPGCYVDSTLTATGHGLNCGTSMASPHVSGAVALFIQKYRGLPGVTSDPSPALVKAAFLGNCFDLAGSLDADNGVLGHPFDNKQGWGRMNLPAVITPDSNGTRYYDNPLLLDNTGQEWSTTVTPLNPALPMRIMLVWTDAPGHGLGGSTPAWVNDLDLIVDAPGGQYLGNNFNAGTGWSQTGGIADNRNNTEGVFFGPTAPGSATIRVRATNIPGDGVPNVGDATDQDFAIVVYNGAVEPGFALQVTPASDVICAPATSVRNVQTTQILGFTTPITLAALGLPAGATASFVPNPVAPGATSTLTITPNGAAAGTYPITVEGTAGTVVRQSAISLGLSTSAPGALALLAPANGAIDVSLTPILSWNAAAQASTYSVEVSTSAGFGSLAYSASGITGTTHTVGSALTSDTVYFWRVRGTNACGNGAYSTAFSFRTRDVPAILLVDDDDNSPNVQSYYTNVLTAMSEDYDIFNTNNTDNEPTALQLAPYQTVIWFTGDEFGGACGPGPAGEAALAAWLDSGGKCLFMCSQDYYYDRGPTAFITGRLGISSATNDNGLTIQTGSNVFGGYGPYTLSYPFTDFSDRVTPGNGGVVAFTDQGPSPTSTTKDATTYRTIFWTFPLEAIPSAADRQALMQRIRNWCGELAPPCLADTNGDDVVDVNDLLAVIATWGPCPNCPPATCVADIHPATGDCQIDVNDLLQVITTWGNCP